MTVSKNFDYKNFITDICVQAEKLIPYDINESDKKYTIEKISDFMNIALSELKNDNKYHYTDGVTTLILQFIGEWTFHKSIDLTRVNFESKLKDNILQQIAFAVFEIAKEAFKKSLPQEQIVQVVEHHVNKTYKEELEKLYNNNEINKETYENAFAQSNIDIYSNMKNCEKYVIENNKKQSFFNNLKPNSINDSFIEITGFILKMIKGILFIFVLPIVFIIMLSFIYLLTLAINKAPNMFKIFTHSYSFIIFFIPVIVLAVISIVLALVKQFRRKP